MKGRPSSPTRNIMATRPPTLAPGDAGDEPKKKKLEPLNLDAGAAKPAEKKPPAATPAAPVALNKFKMPPVSQLRGRPLGRILIKMGKLTRTQSVEALEIQNQKGGAIGQILVELGYVTEADVQLALAAKVGMEPVELSKFDIPRE